MKFSSVATWFAAGLLMSAQQASAVHKDENGVNVYTEQDMNAMLSPAEREKLIETMARARNVVRACLLYTSPSPRDATLSRMPSSA